ncbi:NAD(P)-binding domain-containing protein [Yinghuangia soli]|uniref:NAD(P)-binding domain-containing protein n=1 Tax=Yinghuangia soli TaxID=2908204 RepID=A0AA41Q3W7_9ACTN|nr:NAD(P)-binding domain-containing protein [Yinghuangia soli]MCF2529632.1 NAD(P)-binding domain-containing protein [Yinghuangia soli]
MPQVAVVGVGMIGSGVARALIKAGYEVAVHDVRPEATAAFGTAATVAPTPASAAAGAEALIVAVFDDAQARAALTGPDGAFAALPTGAVVLVLSTVAVPTLAELAEDAAKYGVHVVDCGVTGGPMAALDGRLVSMVGGTAEAVERVRPVVAAFSSKVVHMGGPGTGMQAKLIRNHMQYGIWAVAAEAAGVAEAAGIDVSLLKEIVTAGDELTGGPTALMGVRPADPELMRGAAAMARKDLRASIALADEVGADVPIARLAEPGYHRVFGVADALPEPTEPAPEPEPAPESEPTTGAAGRHDEAADEAAELRARGLAMMSAVYSLPMSLDGASGPYVDLTVDHLFGKIWTRPGLDIRQRRLLTIGVLAALGKDELMELQFSSALERGELTGDQLREVVVHLAHYVGWPLTAGLGGLAEKVARKHEQAASEAARTPGDTSGAPGTAKS